MSEGVGARRRTSARRSFTENTLPAEYLERLEQKRKQLDESIHKYIAAKEREYKLFERELRQEHKLSQGQDGFNNLRGAAEAGGSSSQSAALASERIAAGDTLSTSPSRRSLALSSATSSPHGSRSVNEREKYLEGLFTPAYLSALDDKDKSRLERALSDPTVPTGGAGAVSTAVVIERANSDSYDQAKLKRPSQLVLAQRTSSSGSSADGRLASAMRSPTHRPKHKRVSLAVGDSIVAPSDSVPAALTQNTTPSHSRRRSQILEREQAAQSSPTDSNDQHPSTARTASPLAEEVIFAAETMVGGDMSRLPPAAVDADSLDTRVSQNPSSSIDPDGDLFDLVDVELNGPLGREEDDDDDDADDMYASDDVIVGRVRSADHSSIPPLPADGRTRYDPATGLIPEPEDEKEDSAVPYLSFGPSSSVAPREPGFRRPSVVDDPIYRGTDYQAAERFAIENDVYGSSASKPKGSFTPGSLGESYMARHAEEMMRARLGKRSTSVQM